MKQDNLPFKPYGYYFKGSTFAHILICALCVGIGIFLKSEVDKVRDYNLKLVQSSVKVDVVAMPEFSVQELKSLQQQMADPVVEKVEAARVEEKAPEPIEKDSYKVEQKKTSFQDMLKKYSQKVDTKVAKAEKIDKNKYRPKNQIANKDLKNLVIAGNKLSKGESLVGGKLATESTEFESYSRSLPDLVRANWSIPSYLAEQELRCRIRVFINKSGRLIKAQIFESSGNQEYDLRALNSIKKTSYPIPPEKISKVVRDGEIILGFPL